MEPCTRCGATDRHRMIALMSHWFASHAELPLEGGYFYLCPACYGERIEPNYEAIVTAIQEHQKPERVAREATVPEQTPAGDAAPAGSAPPAGTRAAVAAVPAPPSASAASGAAAPPAPDGAGPAGSPEATGPAPPPGGTAPTAKPARRRKPPSAPPPA